MQKTNNKKRGISILGFLILTFILIIVLSYFKINIKTVVESPTSKENIGYVSGAGKSLWDEYLKEPASYFWNDVWVKIFWQGFINNMERIRDGKPTDFDNAAENLKIKN